MPNEMRLVNLTKREQKAVFKKMREDIRLQELWVTYLTRPLNALERIMVKQITKEIIAARQLLVPTFMVGIMELSYGNSRHSHYKWKEIFVMATYKPKRRVITLKVNDLQQILAHFNNRHKRKLDGQATYSDGTPFGVLRFWKQNDYEQVPRL